MVEAAGIEPASESLRQRRLHAYPGCGGNPRPEAPFPASAPRRINPANRAVGPIPESHRRLGRTAGQARLVDVLSRPAGVVRKDVAYAASARSVLAFVVFPPFTGDGPPTCSRCFMYLRRTQYAPPRAKSGGNSEAENRPRIPVGTVAPHPGPRRESATIVAACDEVARQPTGGGFPAGMALRWGDAGGRIGLDSLLVVRNAAPSGRVSRFGAMVTGGGVPRRGAIFAGWLCAEAGATCFRVGLRRARRGALRVPV